ncbi:NADH pyrophosphatase [bioreactor metagenome]|uniref:NADH pyrophosphatase n=1 Tax=bioreactor metagenome TaxID=1076179 RepID=A0A645AJP9_9ZZZZ
MNCELTNMCMVSDGCGNVLVQHRLPKRFDTWSGLTFPGGHVEPGESIVASVIREVREETGLTIRDIKNSGVVQWYNFQEQSQYLVFLFSAVNFSGELKSSEEGRVEWMPIKQMKEKQLAPNMKNYLRIFLEDSMLQAYGTTGKNLDIVNKDGLISPLCQNQEKLCSS